MKKYFNKKILSFLIFIFIMGIFFGSIFKFFLKENDLLVIKSEFNDYITIINNNTIDIKSNLFNNFIYNLLLHFIIYISGIIIIIIPITVFIIFTKGFSISFLIVSLCSLYKIKGIIYSFIILFPFYLLNIILLILSSYFSISIGKKMINYFIYKKELDLRKILLSYSKIFIIIIILLLLLNIVEAYILPILIKIIV